MSESPRRPVIGYALYLLAATLFAFNGTASKLILETGVPSTRLSQLRVTAALAVLVIVVAATNRAALRLRRAEIPLILAFGILGIAMTQWLYFVAIERLPVGVALLIEFTAPIMVALWCRFGRHEPVRAGVWVALVLALAGLALVAQVWQGVTLSGLGVAAAFGAAAALAVYYLLGERGVRPPEPRDPVSLTMWGFAAAALFWAVVAPWWDFPWASLTGSSGPAGTSAGVPLPWLVAYMVIGGTVLPFWLVMSSLHHISAAQASVVGMTEPVLASAVAYVLLGEAFTPVQVLGGIVVLVGVFLAERAR